MGEGDLGSAHSESFIMMIDPRIGGRDFDDNGLRVPPHSIEAEQSILGGLLLDNDAWDKVGDLLIDTDFYRFEHRLIYASLSSLITASKPADVLTVLGDLESRGKAENAGGLIYLNELSQSVPNASNLRRYAEIVRERSVRRRIITMGGDIATRAFDLGGPSARQLLDDFGAEVHRISEDGLATSQGPVPIEGLVVGMLDNIQAMSDKGGSDVVGTPTGFTELDALIGGLIAGDLIVLAARPSMGKTALALNIAEHVALKERLPVVVFSMEMSGDQLALRMTGSVGKIHTRNLRSGRLTDFEWGSLTDAVESMRMAPMFIDESPAMTNAEIRSRARSIARQSGKIGLIVIDYLQLMAGASGDENRATELGHITRGLKALAKELGCPVVVLSQLNRSVETRTDKRPMMSDLRECLPVDEWVDTPTGPVQLKNRPAGIITSDETATGPAPCEFIEKKYNSTYRVATKFGTFSATAKHRVLTGVGWKEVRDLIPGRDVVACPKKIQHANRGHLQHARLLGWLIGNGGFIGTPSLIYRNELDSEVRAAVSEFGVDVRVRLEQKSANVIDAYLSNGRESGCAPNPLMLWIRSLGLDGKTAHNKCIPDIFMGSSDDTHRELLRGLWETDGTVTGGSAKYATCNEVLARQVKWLLHTLGIRSTVSFYENGHAGLWEVRCATEDNSRMSGICANRVRFPSALAEPSPRYIDPAPAIFVELMAELYSGPERFQRRSDGRFKSISKERMQSMLKACHVSTIAESPYMRMEHMGWAPVTGVQHHEQEVRVCDLHVPQTHCFLTNGLVVHNSGAIEQDADIIMFIYRDDYYNKKSTEPGVAELIVSKQRNGPTGTVKLMFVKPMTRFENMSKDYQRAKYERPEPPEEM